MAHAHMAEGIHNTFVGQDVIGRHQIVDKCIECGHGFPLRPLCAARHLKSKLAFARDSGLECDSSMQTVLDVGAVIIFLLIVPSVAWAVRNEDKDVPAFLAAIVALFVIIMGVVFMSAASQLATSDLSTQVILLVFLLLIAILARAAWASKPAH